MQLVKQLFTAYSQAITSFFYIAIVLVVYLQIQRDAQLEESWLGILRNLVTTQLYYVLLYGLLGGLVTSFVILVFNITIDYEVMLILWPISLFLMLFNQRYLCPSYSVGIVALVSLIFRWPQIDVPPLLMVVGILHIIESLLILIDGHRDSMPVHIEHYRFTPAGAYIMNKMWPVPLVAIVGSGQLIFPFVAVLIYEDLAITQLPQRRTREYSFWIGGYGLLVLILAITSLRVEWLTYFAAIATLSIHELIILFNRRGQRMGEPAFIAPWRGIRILEVLPEGVGQVMGLKQGDIILGINGRQINSEAMLGEILEEHPANLWVKVLRHGGEILELEHRDYKDGISDLGVMLIPRTTGRYYLFEEPKGLLAKIKEDRSNKQD